MLSQELLLAKPVLSADVIDLSVGEAHLLRENIVRIFDLNEWELPKKEPKLWEYPNSNGYAPLVKLLEDKYQAPVIVTNGAKQGLASVFYALKQMDKAVMGMRVPYWALIPPLADMHGIATLSTEQNVQSYLLVMPNNPDGFIMSVEETADFAAQCQEVDMPVIHDAAYYTHVYLPLERSLHPVGDIQIYSISKMFGLSGLRLGFVVCKNTDFCQHILHYMESMTVGTSVISQVFLYDLMRRMEAYPALTQRFEGQSAQGLLVAKKLIKQVHPSVLEIDPNQENIPGMFALAKIKDILLLQKAKINAIDGKHFGAGGHVRLNLAFNEEIMTEIVRRLNSVAEV